MENHGTVIGGRDISDAYQKFELLEVTAKSILYGNKLGSVTLLEDGQINAQLKQYATALPETEERNLELSSINREKRTEILKIVNRACKQGLMLGAYGSISARINQEEFLITPDAISKWDLTLKDIVHVSNGKREKGKEPDSSALLHQSIYEQHPEINAIIITQPTYLTSFAITGARFNVRTIPETWIYLQDVQMGEFGCQFAKENGLACMISKDSPVLILKNECTVVTGTKLLQAFDYLEVAEFSAKSLILSASLGEMIPISDNEIEELGKVMSRWKNYEWKM
ncbi:class II aldolase/adducin family protein [Niabella hibiscisoli]|uniref:class II aldolase/adducin family protein n=1 Tax=Niabella hibiscisoli TaxID=1825928 RepID=UPI001F0EAB47|nr:class II aldolase/adducin family protein [Niabella hibiscisoli]MCH5719015.1 class II aldolase/adducin family protein [Niabella hibiscisoli]